MFPIGDDNSDRTITPVVNYAIIGLNVLVFVFLQGLGGNDQFTYAFSLVPREITQGIDLSGSQIIHSSLGEAARITLYPSPLPVYFNFLTSMFMHGGIAHIFGNMLFLWIFGDNLENLLGHVRYAIFYLLCGFDHPDARGVGCDLGCTGRVYSALPIAAGAGDNLQLFDDRPGLRRDRDLDRLPDRARLHDASRHRRCRLHGSHRRFCSWFGVGEVIRDRAASLSLHRLNNISSIDLQEFSAEKRSANLT